MKSLSRSSLNEISILWSSKLTRLTFFSNSYFNLISFFEEHIFNKSSKELIENVKNSLVYKNILEKFPDAELFDVKTSKKKDQEWQILQRF